VQTQAGRCILHSLIAVLIMFCFRLQPVTFIDISKQHPINLLLHNTADLKSAFDSVDRQALWKALRGMGMPQVLFKLIEDLHTGTTSRVHLDALMSDSFSTSSDVCQGCILTPIHSRKSHKRRESTLNFPPGHMSLQIWS